MLSNNTSPASHQPERDSQAVADRPPLIILLGPTGVGKSDLAIRLALHLNGEIISADSRLLYRGMDIGTAKPSHAERALIPHHLIDVADPDQVWSLAMFQQAARSAIQAIHSRGRLPFLVGGTGQYIRAIIEGWDLPKVEPHPELRAALENWAKEITPKGLHDRLQVLDTLAAERIEPRNLRRTIRALEVILLTGEKFSGQRGNQPSPDKALSLGLLRPRGELYKRIDLRIQDMIERGLVDEVQSLLARGYSPDLPTLSAIGYREIIDYLSGRVSLEEAVGQIKRHTRMFVRRQANWFRLSDPNIHWFDANQQTKDRMEAEIRSWLTNNHKSIV